MIGDQVFLNPQPSCSSEDPPFLPPSNPSSGIYETSPNFEEIEVRNVWAHNLREEFKAIRKQVKKYNYIAMDTEFPGTVARPIGRFRSADTFKYTVIRCNVNLLNLIQLGLSFFDEFGNPPSESCSTWQFNFKFNLEEDMYAEESIEQLKDAGLEFGKHSTDGIDQSDFAELLISSGLVLMDNIRWLTFHGTYNFGYLLKLLTGQNLPSEESTFFELLYLYFPNIYDVKYLMRSCKYITGGLQDVANQLALPRVGPPHQAGPDAFVTGSAFFRIKEMFFDNDVENEKYCGHLYGLGDNELVD